MTKEAHTPPASPEAVKAASPYGRVCDPNIDVFCLSFFSSFPLSSNWGSIHFLNASLLYMQILLPFLFHIVCSECWMWQVAHSDGSTRAWQTLRYCIRKWIEKGTRSICKISTRHLTNLSMRRECRKEPFITIYDSRTWTAGHWGNGMILRGFTAVFRLLLLLRLSISACQPWNTLTISYADPIFSLYSP